MQCVMGFLFVGYEFCGFETLTEGIDYFCKTIKFTPMSNNYLFLAMYACTLFLLVTHICTILWEGRDVFRCLVVL